MSRTGKLLIVGIFCLGACMTWVGSTGTSPVLEQIPYSRDHSLTAAEQAYLAFMVPRLDRLIDEATAVSSLVDKRSRNIFALRAHGNRITALTSEITEWDDDEEVPGNFVASHESLLATANGLGALIDDAQGAFLRLDFAAVGDMIPRFNSTVAAVQTVRDTLPSAGDSPS